MQPTNSVMPSSWHDVLTRVQETLTRYAAAAEARARELDKPGHAGRLRLPPSPPADAEPRGVEAVSRHAGGVEAALAEAQAGLDAWLARAAETGRRLAEGADASLR
jgi:hypothetical protein